MSCWPSSAKLSVCRRKMISSAASTMALKMGMTASMATLWIASKGALKGRLSMRNRSAQTGQKAGGRHEARATRTQAIGSQFGRQRQTRQEANVRTAASKARPPTCLVILPAHTDTKSAAATAAGTAAGVGVHQASKQARVCRVLT